MKGLNTMEKVYTIYVKSPFQPINQNDVKYPWEYHNRETAETIADGLTDKFPAEYGYRIYIHESIIK